MPGTMGHQVLWAEATHQLRPESRGPSLKWQELISQVSNGDNAQADGRLSGRTREDQAVSRRPWSPPRKGPGTPTPLAPDRQPQGSGAAHSPFLSNGNNGQPRGFTVQHWFRTGRFLRPTGGAGGCSAPQVISWGGSCAVASPGPAGTHGGGLCSLICVSSY